MPLYEYECSACGHRFERIQKFSDPPIEECPSCGLPKVQKLLSSPAIQFRGTGWYITDYARSGKDTPKESKESKESNESKESKESKESTKESSASKESKTTTAPASTSTPKAAGD